MLISISIIILAVAIMGLCIWFGYRRGTGKTTVRTVYLLVLAAISYLVAALVATPISEPVIKIVQNIKNVTIQQIITKSPETLALVQYMIAVLMAPLIFAILFGILEALSMIKFGAISNKLVSLVKKDGDPMNKKSRWIGAGIGVVQGLLVMTILTMPLITYNNIIAESDPQALAALGLPTMITGVEKAETNTASLPSGYKLAFNGRSLNTTPTTGINAEKITGKLIVIPSLSSLINPKPIITPTVVQSSQPDVITPSAKSISMPKSSDFNTLINAVGNTVSAYKESIASGKPKTEAVAVALQTFVPYIEESEVVAEITANVAKAAGETWASGESFLGIEMNTDQTTITGKLVNAFVGTLTESTPTNIAENMKTIAGTEESTGVLSVVTSGALSSSSLSFGSGSKPEGTDGKDEKRDESINMIADVLIEVGKNDNMSGVMDQVGELGKEIIQDANINVNLTEEAYDKINSEMKAIVEKSDIDNESLAYEARVSSLADTIVNTAASYNYTISTGEAKILAISLLAYFKDDANMTVEGLMEYFGVTAEDLKKYDIKP